MMPPLVFKYEHADHHTYTQDPKRDPQFIYGKTWKSYISYGSAIPYFYGIFRNLLLQPFGWLSENSKRAVTEDDRTKVQQQAIIFSIIYLLITALSIWQESMVVLLYWFIPRLLAEPIERIIRMCEHVGCPIDNPNMLENSRTVLTNKFFMFLSWNMPHHTAHHAIPLVPFHALPKLTKILEEHIVNLEKGYPQTWTTQFDMLTKSKLEQQHL